jgi:hypothetical protein
LRGVRAAHRCRSHHRPGPQQFRRRHASLQLRLRAALVRGCAVAGRGSRRAPKNPRPPSKFAPPVTRCPRGDHTFRLPWSPRGHHASPLLSTTDLIYGHHIGHQPSSFPPESTFRCRRSKRSGSKHRRAWSGR